MCIVEHGAAKVINPQIFHYKKTKWDGKKHEYILADTFAYLVTEKLIPFM